MKPGPECPVVDVKYNGIGGPMPKRIESFLIPCFKKERFDHMRIGCLGISGLGCAEQKKNE